MFLMFTDGIRKFDYGSTETNLLKYGTKMPPHYPLEKIKTPVAVMWSENDYIVTPEVTYELNSYIAIKLTRTIG